MLFNLYEYDKEFDIKITLSDGSILLLTGCKAFAYKPMLVNDDTIGEELSGFAERYLWEAKTNEKEKVVFT
jgi:hypothetical protein